MKIAITGHTKGIGKAIADLYYTDEVIGFSRSTGYDISIPDVQNLILNESLHADIFINNAYSDFSQCDLFLKLYDLWKNDSLKTIVNINSIAKYGIGQKKFYGQTKQQLAAIAKNKMFDPGKKCRIININPGYVKTDMTKDVHNKYNMLTPEQLAIMIKWCLDQPPGIEVGELSVWCTTLD